MSAAGVSTTLTPAGDSRLSQLADEYDRAEQAYKAAKERLDGLKDALKNEMRTAAPAAHTIDLAGPVPLRLVRSESWRLDSKLLKKERLHVWMAYAAKSESWTLKRSAGAS